MDVGIGLATRRALERNTNNFAKSLERLSSGLRINNASDDPGGRALATKVKTDQTITAQASRNVSEGISYFSIAQTAVTELKNILYKQQSIAEQGSSGTLTSAQRDSLSEELTALESEYNRILASTSYNNRAVFTQENGSLTVQAGEGTKNTIVAEYGSQTAGTPASSGFETQRVSISDSEVEGNGSISGNKKYISSDGQFISFGATSTNLVTGDTNAVADIFVRDTVNGTTERVSVSTAGVEANAASTIGGTNDTGRYVAFESDATNLVASDTNGVGDIFLRDRTGATTTRISVSTAGVEGNGVSQRPSLSATGRYVGFYSNASNLVAGDGNGTADIFVRDTVGNTTTRASVSTAGVEGNGASFGASVSSDGRYVAYYSQSNNLVASDTNAADDVFVRDTVSNITTRVSVSSGAVEGNGTSSSPEISADGNYIVFQSSASNLVAGDTNGANDIFLHDRVGGTTIRISVSSSGTEGNGTSSNPSISEDGRYVSYTSTSSNLVTGDTNGVNDIFRYDRVTGITTRVSVNTAGDQISSGGAAGSAISADGLHVAYSSSGTNLVTGDTNGASDYFLTEVGTASAATDSEFLLNTNQGLSVASEEDSLDALDSLDVYLDEVSIVEGQIGAHLSRFSSAVSSLDALRENYAAAYSKITDIDFAEESANLLKSKVLLDVATAINAQANLSTNSVLSLLDGLNSQKEK